MITKLYKPMATSVITSLLLAMLTVAPVSAQSEQGVTQDQAQNQGQSSCAQVTPGTGPSTAATPVANCFLTIEPGQKHWYKFHVGARSNKGDEENNFNNSNEVDDSDAAIVRLAMDVPGCVTFEIWTLARLNAPPPVGSDASRE